MIRIMIGIIIGAAVTYTLLTGMEGAGKAVKNSVHSLASQVAEATEPTTGERVGNFFNELAGR